MTSWGMEKQCDSTNHARQAIIDVVHKFEPKRKSHEKAARTKGISGSITILTTTLAVV